MNLLLLCGCVEAQHEAEALGAGGRMEQASNLYQRRLIEGLRGQHCNLRVVSAPFIAAWPMQSARRVFHGFSGPSQQEITYVPFHNLWGYRSISRARALRRPVDDFLKDTRGTQRAIVVYAPHTPFLYAAVQAKRQAPDLHLCLIVPDLPRYMNLNENRRGFYDLCKFFDIRLFERLNRETDSFLLFTRPMAGALQVGNRPFLVAEGLAENRVIQTPRERGKTFVYAGRLVRRFGVERLLKAFEQLGSEEYRLVICGDGEMRPVVEAAARANPRICYPGVLSRDALAEVMHRAGALVNPRTGEEEFTRYSFPSKIIEYLQTGLPVVSDYLEGMPPVYRQLMYCPCDASSTALAGAMREAIQAAPGVEAVRLRAAQAHLSTLTPAAVSGRLLALLAGEAVEEY